MKLKELLPVIESSVILEMNSKSEIYDSVSAIPEEQMNHVVKSIKSDKNSLLITLIEAPKPKTLEELGYSFESGM